MSRADFAQFVEIATGSLFEVLSQTTIALQRKMIAQNDYNRIYAAAEKQSKMFSGLRRSLSQRQLLALTQNAESSAGEPGTML